MKTLIKALDIAAFFVFAILFAVCVLAVMGVSALLGKRRFKPGMPVNRFSFAICDLISNKYDGMFEDLFLDDYINEDHYIYFDYANGHDRFEILNERVFFHSLAAHPDNAIYKAGFCRVSMLLVELKALGIAFGTIWRSNITFVKSHDPHLLGLNALIMARLFRLPYVLHLNSDFDMKYKGLGKTSSPIFFSRGLERFFERIIMRAANLIMADRNLYRNSPYFPFSCTGKYRAFGVRVAERHYAAVSSRKDRRKELGIEGKKALFYVGRLHPVKYPEDAIRAMALVKKAVSNAVLVMAGDGPMKEELKTTANFMGLGDSVLFLGSRNNDELTDLFYTADVLLAPHGGVTLLEAALASTPIVAYDFDWHPEFIENGKMGYIVPFRDIDELARKAIAILTNESLRNDMRAYCRRYAESRYPRRYSIENEKKIYDELIGIL
ncbi:MAG: glycosyltransferase family 4 protein [Candidatus Omnitrophica bacterium]|nr:glycosyltransferase family 4 protein [Candidatus Omnitrophota bacterium]